MASPEIIEFNIIRFRPVEVLRLMSMSGMAGAQETQRRLADLVGGVGRQAMYGIYLPSSGVYYSAVRSDPINRLAGSFNESTIRGGLYAATDIEDWMDRRDQINHIAKSLDESVKHSDSTEDPYRPHVEVYHDEELLTLMVPVQEPAPKTV